MDNKPGAGDNTKLKLKDSNLNALLVMRYFSHIYLNNLKNKRRYKIRIRNKR